MIDRAGQVWELDGGAIILVVRSHVVGWTLLHDVLVLMALNSGSRFNHVEGVVSTGWREGSQAWEEPEGDRRRIG